MLLILRKVVTSSGEDFDSVSLVSKQFRKLACDVDSVCFQTRLGRTCSIERDTVLSFFAFLERRVNLESLTLKDMG